MVQVGGQRAIDLTNFIGDWHSDHQIRVGEYERRVFEEKKNFAGKVTEIAKTMMRMVTFEGLQPTASDAFLKGDNIQCEMDAVRKSNEEWKYWIAMPGPLCTTLLVLQD